MKNLLFTIKTLMFLCYLLLSFAANSKETLINFKNVDLNQAKQSGKKILISFSADWCLPCKMMEESLYSDRQIATLVNDNFEAIKADIDSPIGEGWSEIYNVNTLPTVLFANVDGIEFERLRRAPSRDEFISLVRKIIETKSIPFRAHNPTPVRIDMSNKSTNIVSVNHNAFATNHAIQLGAFSTLDKAKLRINQLSAIRETDLSIIKEKTNERILFKVVHMDLSLETAKSLLRSYHEKGYEAFIRIE